MRKNIGEQIKKIRQNLPGKPSMKDFGEMFNPPASKGVVSNWENNYNYPNEKRLKRIAELGNISVDELLYGSPIREYIMDIVKDDESFNENESLNKKALEDTISCFEDLPLNVGEMDFTSVLLNNIRYYKDNNGFRIHDKDSYTEYLEQVIEAIRFNLDAKRLEEQAQKEINDQDKRFKNPQVKNHLPSKKQLLNKYETTYRSMIQQNERILNKLKK